MKIKQVFVHYKKWECYQNGMWFKVDKKTEIELLKKAIDFTSNHILYGNAMNEVVFKWENSMLNFLTNQSINRKAYLGHCAVCYKLKIPEYIVRMAWKHLNEKQRILADKVALETIKKWELWYKQKLVNTSNNGKKDAIMMGFQMRLKLN
jgi:hypothetical protein